MLHRHSRLKGFGDCNLTSMSYPATFCMFLSHVWSMVSVVVVGFCLLYCFFVFRFRKQKQDVGFLDLVAFYFVMTRYFIAFYTVWVWVMWLPTEADACIYINLVSTTIIPHLPNSTGHMKLNYNHHAWLYLIFIKKFCFTYMYNQCYTYIVCKHSVLSAIRFKYLSVLER